MDWIDAELGSSYFCNGPYQVEMSLLLDPVASTPKAPASTSSIQIVPDVEAVEAVEANSLTLLECLESQFCTSLSCWRVVSPFASMPIRVSISMVQLSGVCRENFVVIESEVLWRLLLFQVGEHEQKGNWFKCRAGRPRQTRESSR